MNLLLTAGKATRMGALAPDGCKALTVFRDRPMIEWQLDVLGDATIVCRSEHVQHLRKYGTTVVDDSLSGPVAAVKAGLRTHSGGPVTIVYADTFFSELPSDPEWCGTGIVDGGREWDVVDRGLVHYRFAHEPFVRACAGVYRFADPWRLLFRVGDVIKRAREVQMGAVLNGYRVPFIDIPSWRDVGTAEALEAAA